MTDRKGHEKTKHLLIGAKVKFPEKPNNFNEIGTITDIYFQPAINLDELDKLDKKDKDSLTPIFVSKDEPEGITQLKPKTLCMVQFSDCVHITESKDLILVDGMGIDEWLRESFLQ